jgi:hypothetical protein
MSYNSSNENLAPMPQDTDLKYHTALKSPRGNNPSITKPTNQFKLKTTSPKSLALKAALDVHQALATKATTHSFIENYEKHKAASLAQLKSASEGTSSLPHQTTNPQNHTTSTSPVNYNETTAANSTPFTFTNFLPLPPSSPNRKKTQSPKKTTPESTQVFKEPLVEKRSGHSRKSSNESVSLLETANTVKHSSGEPSLVKTGSTTTFGTGDRNAFLRQSVMFNDSFDDESNDDN